MRCNWASSDKRERGSNYVWWGTVYLDNCKVVYHKIINIKGEKITTMEKTDLLSKEK